MRIRTSRTPLPSITYAGAHMSAGATELARRGFAQPSRGASGPQGGDLRSRKFMSRDRASCHKRSAPHSHHPGLGAWPRGPVLGPGPRGPGPSAPGLRPRAFAPGPGHSQYQCPQPHARSHVGSSQVRTYVFRGTGAHDERQRVCSGELARSQPSRARRRQCRRSVLSKTRKTARRSAGKWARSA